MNRRCYRVLLVVLCAVLAVVSCGPAERPLAPRSQTWAELRAVRGEVTVAPPGEHSRSLLPRERLSDGEAITVAPSGLAWLRRDGGATMLVRGPAKLTLHAEDLDLEQGSVFVDAPSDSVTTIHITQGDLKLGRVRASVEMDPKTGADVYVLAGEVHVGDAHGSAGEHLVLQGSAGSVKISKKAAIAWHDWTGGLATTDQGPEPPPFGVGTVGARKPGDQGAPRSPLAIQRMDVRVTIDGDLATTEVDELFFNGASDTVEGLYTFRTPEGAVLTRFGVDREGALVWGRVKEKKAAQAQYQANVYQGSTEDPALLEWDSPGVYRAKLYPIGPGQARRVVVRYTEWLSRSGPSGQRRLYVFPMAAEGADESLPHVEFFGATFDLRQAGATEIRSGMRGVRQGDVVMVRAHDLVPRADLCLELFDQGVQPQAYTSPHQPDLEVLPKADQSAARERGKGEMDYVLVPIRAADVPKPPGGVDLVIVVDTSAATEPASLAIARSTVGALLAHLAGDDRAVVWAGDASLRPVVDGWTQLRKMDDGSRQAVAVGLATVERGGATDLGAMLAAAAAQLDPTRRGALIYLGDGRPTVGELAVADLRDRLAKLARPVRIFGLGIGQDADMGMLKAVARGGFAERVTDAWTAARASLRLLETAERAAWLGVSIDLGPSVERIYPRELNTLVAEETVLLVGRIKGAAPTQVRVTTPAGVKTLPLSVRKIFDSGDLRSRWAEGRLQQMLDEAAGQAALIDLGVRNGIITPVTSFYVPTRNEMSSEERQELDRTRRTRSELQRLNPDSALAGAEPQLMFGMTGCMSKSASRDEESATAPAASAAAVQVDLPQATPAEEKDFAERPKAAPQRAPGPGAAGGGKRSGAAGDGTKGQIGDLAAEPYGGAAASAAPTSTATLIPNAKSGALDGRDESGGVRSKNDNGIAADSESRSRPAKRLLHAKPSDEAIDANKQAETETTISDALTVMGKTAQNAKLAADERRIDGEPVQVTISVERLPHRPVLCSGAITLSFDERVALWRERLARAAGNPRAVASEYSRAIAWCEAPTWRERSKLLSMMLDALPQVAGRVALWRIFFNVPGVGDTLYQGLLARVRTADEMRQLHAALGLRSIDPGILEKLVRDARDPGERVKKLRDLWAIWPDDFSVALRLLDALEDANDDAGARDFARQLRSRPDVNAHVRTEIGELYLRIAKRAGASPQAAADEAEARRTFGEIVEFAPQDPVARRRLGDLLRSHGWFAEAARQYETLAKLSPDDPSVQLLLASASNGLGKLEEAVRWAEKISDAGAPGDTGLTRTARSLAATFLAWGRDSAATEGRKDEAALLRGRAVRLLAKDDTTKGAARVTLTWSHPELHPTLWSNARGAMMPAPDGDVIVGVSQVMVPLRPDAAIEVRTEADEVEHAARLGAQATLTVVFDEGLDGEKIVKRGVTFVRGGPPTIRFTLAGKEVSQ